MGSPGDKCAPEERPPPVVEVVRPFALGKYEATFHERDAWVTSDGCTYKPNDNGWGRAGRPVFGMSWQDAQQYAD